MDSEEHGWSSIAGTGWSEPALVRSLLSAGADPDVLVAGRGRPLHQAAEWGTPEVLAELAPRVADIDAVYDGRTALWIAVQARKADNARFLAEAGADPWRPMMAGWSPGRLNLAGDTPGLFAPPSGTPGLSPQEADEAAASRIVIAAFDDIDYDGYSVACVKGIDAAEAVRRLGATVFEPADPERMVEEAWSSDGEDALLVVGATDVPGGCVVGQSWAYGASMPVVSRLLSAGTVCYSLYANPKSGNQGSSFHNGAVVEWDGHPGGGWSDAEDSAEEILRTFLYSGEALAYSCAYAGLRPVDDRALVAPDLWLRMPPRDYWSIAD
ncbi:ankyrin repeat domain-containing protein [Phytomonospora sp. NPDC050363]|uniref:ankyrin repeat domain-containing protein n=1 Tax=Phytomonospora sp. NPDC050363 TaxID=3155642 RepID=UPI0033E7364E